MKWVLPQEKQIGGERRGRPAIGHLLTISLLDTNVYGFLTVSEDAKCGVCAHEIGHLGKSSTRRVGNYVANYSSIWLARSLRHR